MTAGKATVGRPGGATATAVSRRRCSELHVTAPMSWAPTRRGAGPLRAGWLVGGGCPAGPPSRIEVLGQQPLLCLAPVRDEGGVAHPKSHRELVRAYPPGDVTIAELEGRGERRALLSRQEAEQGARRELCVVEGDELVGIPVFSSSRNSCRISFALPGKVTRPIPSSTLHGGDTNTDVWSRPLGGSGSFRRMNTVQAEWSSRSNTWTSALSTSKIAEGAPGS